jgi:hypothetical protein
VQELFRVGDADMLAAGLGEFLAPAGLGQAGEAAELDGLGICVESVGQFTDELPLQAVDSPDGAPHLPRELSLGRSGGGFGDQEPLLDEAVDEPGALGRAPG